MPQECANCRRDYAATEANCPYCLTPNPRMEEVPIPGKLRWNSEMSAQKELAKHAGPTGVSVSQIQGEVQKPMKVYSMAGSMKATTTVKLANGSFKKFTTTDNMHSEMVALNYMLTTQEWVLYLGAIRRKRDGAVISPEEFVTKEPHCGFCTFMLQVLELPLGTPTMGNYNLAGNANYPLPKAVGEDEYVLARILGGGYAAFHKIKSVLNSFVNVKPEAWVLEVRHGVVVNDHHYAPDSPARRLTWDDVKKSKMLPKIWAMIFKSLYERNK